MARRAVPATLARMDISVHTLRGAHPVETGWVDEALSSAYGAGEPLGALVGRPLSTGTGIMLVGWAVGGPDRFHMFESRSGDAAGPATYMQVVTFEGPRTGEWAAAEERAASGRLWPAVRDVAGIVRVMRMRRADGGYLVVVLSITADAFDEAQRAILSTDLLPGEDPAQMAGPDSVVIYRLMHADLPVDEPVTS